MLSAPVAVARGTAAFAKIDKDSDGLIDSAEYQGTKRSKSANLARKHFLLLDKDEDGGISPLEFFGGKKLAKLLSNPAASDNGLAEIISRWAQSDPAAAADWVSSLSQREGTELVVSRVVDAWANSDPAGVANWINSLPPNPERDRLVEEIVNRWAEEDPNAARDWIDSQPPREGGRSGDR